MQQLQQIAPISDLRKDHASVVAMLAKGPVVLTARGRPAGVFVSPTEWDRIAGELAELRREKRNHFADQQFRRAASGDYIDYQDVKAELDAIDHAPTR